MLPIFMTLRIPERKEKAHGKATSADLGRNTSQPMGNNYNKVSQPAFSPVPKILGKPRVLKQTNVDRWRAV